MMKVGMDKRTVLTACCLAAVLSPAASALITGSHGNSPIQHDMGWPAGSLQVANLPIRLGYWVGPPFGGGEFHFEYRCKDTEQFNSALQLFAAIESEKLELVVHNGPKYSFWLKQNDEELEQPKNHLDWSFTVWNPESWNRLYHDERSYMMANNPNYRKPVAAPRIDLYITSDGSIKWEDVEVPENITVIDKRPGAISPEFAGKGLLHGTVVDMETKQPIAGAQIALSRREDNREYKEIMHGKTDQKGFCQISGIPAGYYYIHVKAEGYVPRNYGSYQNKRPEHLKFRTALARPALAGGSLVDTAGNPVAGVKITARNVIGSDGFGYSCIGEASAVTDVLGRFMILSLPKGMMTIRILDRSLHLQNSIFEQYKVPSDDIKLVVTATATVRGKVVGADGKRPEGQIILELEVPAEEKLGKWGYSGLLAPDGAFEIKGVPPGEYVITAKPSPWRTTYQPNKVPITVEGGRQYDIEVKYAEPD